uniref:Sortilin related VPS10 domain containing receptor 1 n=1 Tax=Fundulus heteroclitus TaxID=8078 RepID=A0A3Q2QXQ3_FUNHE
SEMKGTTGKEGPQKKRHGDHQKLSHPPPSASSASGPFPNNASGERDTRLNLTGDGDAFALRARRSAETWSEFRGGGLEDTSVSDQEEFQLTSSTFPLAGDTAHNQAMVHWSGQNSSVSIAYFVALHILRTAVFDAVSTDYGTTYEKLNEKVGTRSILSYLYVSPNNKRKIMLLTDPEVESSLLISLDEGASYQKHSLGFDILSLLFHPEQEDWILAYSHDQKLYVSIEFGRRWQLVHNNSLVSAFLVFSAIFSCLPTGSQYITCKLQNCSDGNKGKPFPGFIIPNSLVVQDEYVFIQVVSGQAVHYVSYKRNAFYPMKLPKYTLPKVRLQPWLLLI